MALTVRKKIWFGTVFLFILLLFTGGTGIYFTVIMKEEAKAVLQANYESLEYCHIMQQQLDNIDIDYNQSISLFENALKKQERNITEPGEDKATLNLRLLFNQLKSGDTTKKNFRCIKSEIQNILYLNMYAIYNKNLKSEATAERALSIIVCLAVIVLMISFTFSVNFPTIVTNPIKHLTEAIQEISNKNYKHRIYIENKDEFGKLADAFNVMAERLEYFENSNLNKLMFEKNRAEAVINSLKEASIGIDKNNIILFANFQALQLLGLKQAEIVGVKVDELAKKNDLFSFLVNEASSAPFNIIIENKENYFTKEVIEVAQGEGNSKVIVLRNITSFKELDVAKTNFIATISHELKTPLAASDFSLKLLEDERTGKLTNEQKELIINLKQDNKRILKIISELLNLSQIESGRIQLNVQEVNAYSIVDNAIETVATSAKDKNISIVKELDKNLPTFNADVEKCTWVLNNFLTNAIKYSDNDSKIIISSKKENNQILFSVEDFGLGIANEYLTRVFERYFQIPGTKSIGNGLGLAISKDFIEAQKGKIWVKSDFGKGTVFSFSLPI